MASVPRKKNFFKPNVAILGGMTEPDQPSFVPLPLVIRLVRRLSVETSVPRDLWIEDIRTTFLQGGWVLLLDGRAP